MTEPTPEKVWTTNTNQAAPPGVPEFDEPVSDDHDADGLATEWRRRIDRDPTHATQGSSGDDSSVEVEGGKGSGSGSGSRRRSESVQGVNRVKRTESNWTHRTETTSIAPSEVLRNPTQVPRKRTWGERVNPFKHKTLPPIPDERGPSREYKAGFFSKLTFQWIAPLMGVGYQRPLEVTDIWEVNPDRGVEKLAGKLIDSFHARQDGGSKMPLAMALYDTVKFEFLLGAACQLTSALLQVFSPFVLRYLITFASDAYFASTAGTPAPDIGHGIGLVIGISCMQLVQSSATNHFIYRGMLVGGQCRAMLIAVIFDKSLTISGRARAGVSSAPSSDEKRPEGMKPGSKAEKAWFRQQLKNKQNAKADAEGWSNGRIVNLMSTDTYRIDQAAGMFHIMWTAPIQIIVALILLLINLSYSALAGFAFICILMPALAKSIKSLMRRRGIINKITDQRVSLTQEIISSVRFVKFFGWELSFLDRLSKLRDSEISKIAFLLSIRNGIMAVAMTMPIFASMLAFITYSQTNNVLDPAPVFSSLALFNSLRIPLNLMPQVLGQVIDAWSSLKRIENFLNAEERNDEAVWNYEAKDAILVDHAEFTWERTKTASDSGAKDALKSSKELKADAKAVKAGEKAAKEEMKRKSKQQSVSSTPTSNQSSEHVEEEQPFKLRQINLAVGRRELIGVIGSVGCGKSSLLGALAGDMRRTAGTVTFGASRAFCPQYAWIQNASVRDNITFGKDFESKWYEKVIDACALRPDLEMLPSGDQTEIGERGITVSGGQKQRLNIARAIYFDADIVLMDDPLSAVDAHVGRHIMDNAICGILKDKCRVLATHQLHVLHRVDRIVWMKDGTIHKVATFPELMASDEEFQHLMATTAVEEKEEEQAEVINDEVEEEKKGAKQRRKKPTALMQQEERAVNSVGWDVYTSYVRAAGSLWVAPLILLLLIVMQGSNIVTSLWLSWWTSDNFGYSDGQYIGVYAVLGVFQAVSMFVFGVALTVLGTKASKVLLGRAIYRVLRSPMSFFDTTPLGRITNRFAKDVDTMDNMLTESIRMFMLTMGMIVAVFILITVFYYYFAVALAPLIVIFLFAASYYRASAREIKRHEAVLRSVVFSRFGEAVTGISTIRAYGLEHRFARSVAQSIDSMNGAYFLTYANQRWLSTRLDVVGICLVFTCGILVVTARFSVNPSTGGLVLSYILSVVQMIQFTVRQLAEVENNMNSTERVNYYGTALEEEAALHKGNVRPSWPEKGDIVFDNVQMRYRDGLPLVLQGLDMHVRPGERIGVVGRTGAGKSTIMSTLFRLQELAGGRIIIDGVDISTIGLHDLRSKLAIIPQDPTLFKGTIRSNLDPFNEHSDLTLWSALRQADLVHTDNITNNATSEKRPDTPQDNARTLNLDSPVEDEGLNFSLGQRQLLALSRALVRNSQIIVCDEATSSVDFETDEKIQKTIVHAFAGKTLLCIAHRLKTIISYDRILVMDSGRVAELDEPLALWESGGVFRGMCERSGIRREDFLRAEVSPLGQGGDARREMGIFVSPHGAMYT